MEDIELFVPEFDYHEKKTMWYLCVLLLAFSCILVALLTNNASFIAVVMLGGTLLLMRSRAKPKLVPFAIHDKGIYLKNKFWAFEDIKDFSLYKIDSEDHLSFNPKGELQIPIRVPIKDPEKIRQKLKIHVSEVEYQESLMDVLIRISGL